jgi:RNA polymerase sigma-70 factor (ECF subfamily)
MPTLVAVAQTPEQAPFAEEAITYLDVLYRGALRLTRDPAKAEDLVQDTYVRALRYQQSYRPGTNMKAWLFAIMRNLFWDRFKGGRPESLSLDGDGEHGLYELVEDATEGPETMALDRIAREIHREVVLLVDVEGFPYKETADILGVPIGTVMSRLHRARSQLQKALAPYARESGIIQGESA